VPLTQFTPTLASSRKKMRESGAWTPKAMPEQPTESIAL
jgi:hypothetical protein